MGGSDREGAAKTTTLKAANKTEKGMRPASSNRTDCRRPGDEALEAAAALRSRDAVGVRAGLRSLVGARLAASGTLRLAGDCLGLAPPLAVYAIVRFVQTPPTADASFATRYFGYVVGAALLLASALQAMCLHLHRRLTSQAATRARSALTVLVLDKALTLSTQAMRSVGDVPAVVELATVETGRVRDLLDTTHSFWAAPLQLALSVVLLAKLLGVRSSFAGVAALVLAVSPVASLLASKVAALSKRALTLSGQRAALLTKLFQHIRVVKLCAWETPLLARVDAVRTQELQCLRGMIVWSALRRTLTLFQAGPMIAAIVAFSVYVCVQAAPLTPDRAFPAIVLFAIIQSPTAELPMAVKMLVQANASMSHIETFLSLDEFKPLSLKSPPPPPVPASPMRPHPDDPPFELRSAVFRLDSASSKTLRTISSRDLISSANASASRELTRLSVVIPRGKLTLVIGGSQSGKSTLLAALVGELTPVSGFVNLPRAGTVSFAPQTPFIMTNRSVSDNILFGARLDQARLDAVLQACELDADVAGLPDGLLTVVGDADDNVRGFWTPDESLKQRIALARAVYSWSRTELFVVDDALSSDESLDAMRVLRRCLLDTDALLAGTTRVLAIDATANTNALVLARTADWIVVMDQRKVVQAGSFADLSTRQPNGKLAQLMSALEAKKEEQEGAISETGSNDGMLRRSRGSRSSSDGGKSRRRSSTFSAPDAPVHWLEEAHSSSVLWSAYAFYWSSCGALVVAGAFGVLVSSQLSAVSTDLWLARWTDDTSAPSYSTPAPLAVVGLSIYAYMGISTLVLTCLGDVVTRYAGLRASKAIHARLVRHVVKGSMRFFDAAPIDHVLFRLSDDIASIDHSLVSAVVQLVGLALALTSMLVVQASVAPLLLLALTAPILVCYVPLHLTFAPQLRSARRLEGDTDRGIASTIKQTLQGIATIRVFDMTTASRRQLAGHVDENARASTRRVVLNCWLNAQLQGLGALLTLVVVCVVVSRRAGDISDAMAGLVLVYAFYSTLVLGDLTRHADDVADAMRSVERVSELCSTRFVDTEPLTLARMPKRVELMSSGVDRKLRSAVLSLRPQWPEHGQLNLINVSVTPAHSPSPSSPSLGPLPVLRGVSLAIRGGDKVGFCAVDGSVGRSRSLLWALFRLVPTSGGRIEIDGVPTAQVDLLDLRSRLAVIPREPLVFAGESLRFNLDPTERSTDEQMWTALRSAGLDKCRSTSLDAPCLGEEQASDWGRKLWLARALLRQPRVLCVDASEEDNGMIEAVRRLSELKDTTVVAIARRATAIADYDQVVVLDDGRVVEHGSPPRLLREKPRGAFASLLDGADDWTPTV